MSIFLKKYNWLAPLLFMAVAMLMWAIMENIPRYYSQSYKTFEIVWMRYTVHLIFMLIVFGPRVKLRLVRTRRLGLQFVRGMFMMGMHLTFIFALFFIPVTGIMAGFWVAPLLLIGISAWRGERADWVQWLVTLAAFGGVLIMSRPLSNLFHPAILLALGMALCFVIYMQISRSIRDEDLLASLFYTAFSVWIVLSMLMPFYWVTPTWRDVLLFIALGLVGYIGLYGFDKAAEAGPTWQSAPFGFIQPVLILFSDWVLRGVFPGRISLAAAGLVAVSLGFLIWRNFSLHKIPG